MILAELLGRKIQDIHVKHIDEFGGLDKAESYIILDNGFVVGIPWKDDELADEIYIKQLTNEAESIRKLLKKAFHNLLNQTITDIIIYENDNLFDTAFIELANGYLITEITIAPHGLGYAGLWYFESISALETQYGKEYKRLIKKK